MKSISRFFFMTILVPVVFTSYPGYALVRAAFDIGSGGLKVTVADVNPETKTINTIYYSDEVPVLFKHDMEVSGESRFSEAIQQHAFEVLAKLKQELQVYNPVEWSGVATAASRQAQNAGEFYEMIRKKLGITIKIISQEEEGALGFLTAMSVSGVSRENLVTYDSGSGSFQVTTLIGDNFEMLGGQVAYIHALATLVREVRGQQLRDFASPNPIAQEEAELLVKILQTYLPEIPAAFAQKFKHEHSHVVGIGNKYYIFALAARAIGKNSYTKEELWQAIQDHCDLHDEHLVKFPRPHEGVLGMLLLYTVMDGLGIDKLTFAFANGSCEGILIDSRYWQVKNVLESLESTECSFPEYLKEL